MLESGCRRKLVVVVGRWMSGLMEDWRVDGKKGCSNWWECGQMDKWVMESGWRRRLVVARGCGRRLVVAVGGGLVDECKTG